MYLGFDGSCPLGPALVATELINPHELDIKAIHNGNVVQDSNTRWVTHPYPSHSTHAHLIIRVDRCREMIFDIPKTISFLSQGTTLERGTVIMTGTGPGIGAMREPKVVLKDGDDMRVEIGGIGTLVNQVYYE